MIAADDTLPPDMATTIPAPPVEDLVLPVIPRSTPTLDWSGFASADLDEEVL